jgi:hypothetical protein
MNKQQVKNDLKFTLETIDKHKVYLAITLINLIIYSAAWLTGKEIGKPLLWVLFIFFPSLIILVIYEYKIKKK